MYMFRSHPESLSMILHKYKPPNDWHLHHRHSKLYHLWISISVTSFSLSSSLTNTNLREQILCEYADWRLHHTNTHSTHAIKTTRDWEKEWKRERASESRLLAVTEWIYMWANVSVSCCWIYARWVRTWRIVKNDRTNECSRFLFRSYITIVKIAG